MTIGTNMKVFNKSTIGESHIADQKPCQDFSLSYQSESGLSVAIVSDGHGGKPYFRSHIGSEKACNVALDAIKTFVKDVDAANFSITGREAVRILPLTAAEHSGKLDKQEDLLRQLSKHIILNWRKEVEEDAAINILTEWERVHVDQEYLAQIKVPEKLHRAYGCTLMAFATTPTFWFALHIGDGKCFAFYDKGAGKIWDEPLPWDEKCFLNRTTSICANDAYESFRFAYGGIESLPIAVFLGSDGIDDTFGEDNLLSDFYIKILKEILFSSQEEVVDALEAELPILSRRGSQDDMSVACLYDEKKLVENIKYILEHQISLVESRIDASEKRITELISRKQELEHYLEVKEQFSVWNHEKIELEKRLKISSNTNIDIELGFADKDIVRENENKSKLCRKQNSLLEERSKVSEISSMNNVNSEKETIASETSVSINVEDSMSQNNESSKETDSKELTASSEQFEKSQQDLYSIYPENKTSITIAEENS